MTWPSTFASGTKGYMKDRIDDELKRSGTLTTRIDQCIADAIAVYQRYRFRFSEGYDGNFNTVTGQEYYSAAANPVIQNAFQFDYVAIQIGTARFKLSRLEPIDIDLLTQSGTQQGQPYAFSYFNEQLRFYPVPSAVYPIIVAAHEVVLAPTSDSQAGNRWMTDGERLIRSRAKYELSLNYGIDYPDLAARMLTVNQYTGMETGAVADAFAELSREAAKITSAGRIRPTQF